LYVGSILAGSTSALAAAAENEASAEDRGAIVVTGQRGETTVLPDRSPTSIYGTETSVLDTPRSISQISAEQLLHDPLRSTDDFVKYAPGITRGGGQGNNAAPTIRGLLAEVFQNGQRIYKDGNDHPLNLNAFESADIVAGPSSVIFGPSSGTGGYVNYLTKKPYFDRQHTQFTAQVGTWVPGDSSESYPDVSVMADTGGPISDKLAYRISVKGQRGATYYRNVRNNYNSFYGALSWHPSSSVRVDWNGSYDNYYNFNVTRGLNRPTQQLVDDGLYYGGRATPLINTPGVGIWSPVFASSNPTAAPIGWQLRNRNAQAQYVPGAVQTTPLPGATPAQAGTIVGWVYDPTIPGNGLTDIKGSVGSGRPEDINKAKRYISQLQVGVDLAPDVDVLSSTYFQRSVNTNDSVGSFLYQNRSNLIDQRLELRAKASGSLFGLPVTLQSNTGVSYRSLTYSALSANSNFNYNPYDLTLDPSTITPSALYGLPLADPNVSGSWIGAPGVPQRSPYFGYLNLPVMVPVQGGLYAEIGGSPPGGAVYTSAGHIRQASLFTQQNLSIADTFGVNLGVNITRVDAEIRNPVFLNAAQAARRDSGSYTLPSYQGSVWLKPTANTTLYFTYDRSTAVNTGVFGSFLTWGPNNQLNDLSFDSISELYEAGIKADILPGKLFASATGFVQSRQLTPDLNGNIAKVRIKGAEASLRFQGSRNFSAGANFTWLDGVNTYIVPGGFSPFGFVADNATVFGDSNRLIGRAGGRYPLPGVPKFSVNGFADYHFDNGLGAQVEAWWTDKFITNLSSTVVAPAGHQANLTIYYRQPAYDVSLRLLNFTDQRNYLNALTAGEFLQPTAPFSVQAQVSFRL
jgi:hypothetical protein